MHVQVSASAGDVGGRHLDERHDCEQHGDDGSCDERAGEPGDGSGRAGETAGGGGSRGKAGLARHTLSQSGTPRACPTMSPSRARSTSMPRDTVSPTCASGRNREASATVISVCGCMTSATTSTACVIRMTSGRSSTGPKIGGLAHGSSSNAVPATPRKTPPRVSA
jgi:hypothetical protein